MDAEQGGVNVEREKKSYEIVSHNYKEKNVQHLSNI